MNRSRLWLFTIFFLSFGGFPAQAVEIADAVLRRWGVTREEYARSPGVPQRLERLESVRLGQIDKLKRARPADWLSPQFLTPEERLTAKGLEVIGEREPLIPSGALVAVPEKIHSGPPAASESILHTLSKPDISAECLFDGNCPSRDVIGQAVATPNPQQPTETFTGMVQRFVNRALGDWNRTSDRFPENQKRYTEAEQKQNAKELKEISERLTDPHNPPDDREKETQGRKIFGILLGEKDSTSSLYDDMKGNGTLEVLSKFAKAAKDYDPDMGYREIFQAGRNVWMANTLQMLLGVPVALTDSLFGYSMLYPYTDNFVDDDSISKKEKKDFAVRLRLRLEGKQAETKSPLEEKIWDMVAHIEKEWARKDYPEVYESLVAIHDAQTASLKQRVPDGALPPSLGEILRISATKGGTSVLPDSLLSKGKLTEEESYFSFFFGFALQLLDDIQDVARDLSERHYTLFSAVAKTGVKLDTLVNRLFHLLEMSLQHAIDGSIANGHQALRTAMLNFCRVLVLEAAAKNPHLFSESYLEQLRSISTVGLQALKKMEIEKMIFKSVVPDSGDFTPR